MKILNFGSLNIDVVYQVNNFVRAGETISSTKREIFPGGKGLNQSIALSKAGGKEVYHAGGIGIADGIFLKDILKSNGVKVDFVRELEGASGHAIIQVNEKGNNCIILFSGANSMQDEPFIDEVLSSFKEGDYLVVQNEINNLSLIIEKAHKKKMVIFLNPSPFNEVINSINLNYIDYFILNEIEATDMCECENLETKDLIMTLKNKFPFSKFVLTLGKDGVIYFDKQVTYSHGIYDVPVVDTTAAGDTFSGYFISSLSNGIKIEEALRLASIASSLAVSKKGAAISIPTINEVREAKLKPIRK
ncbi:MAG: ribokinase [Spirochaetaceae bacterium]|nr:ribokinase [Spirochaetaceae bacterium]